MALSQTAKDDNRAMKVIHICNDFCGSKVHSELYRRLDALGVEQLIYTYYRDVENKEGKNRFEGERTVFFYQSILRKWHRILYHRKICLVYNNLREIIGKEHFDLVHATTLFSDGAIAYRMYKEFGIPYVVTVRGTDINEFLSIAFWSWSMGLKVLRNASKIIFISKGPMEKFFRHFLIKRIVPEIKEKCIVQPNGIDDYWLNNITKRVKKQKHDIIYVGRFNLVKNVVRLIEAVLSLRNEYKDIHLHLVGGGGFYEKKVSKLVNENKRTLIYYGRITDKKALRDLYRECDIFAMPSIHETFGLVYIEALTQGLPILYTKEQGVDGLLSDEVGEKVDAMSVKNIANGLAKLLDSQDGYYNPDAVDFESFRWNTIAKRYDKLYKNVLNEAIESSLS